MAINKLRGTKNADGTAVAYPDRTGSYKEAYVIPVGTGRIALAPTRAPTSWLRTRRSVLQLTGHVAPAIAETSTKSIIHFFNAGSLDVYLDYLS